MSCKGPDEQYFGKYQGTVFSNEDPEFRGRIQAVVPDVLGLIPTTWALPCVPVTGLPGLQSGVYVVPAKGASVWMEFENGDPEKPIWTGCFWGSPAEVPLLAQGNPLTPNIVLQTVGQNTIRLGGDPASGIVISCGPLAPNAPGIAITPAGIVISDGKFGTITLAGGMVTINNGALIVKQP